MKEPIITPRISSLKCKIFWGIVISIILLICIYFFWRSVSYLTFSNSNRLALLQFLGTGLSTYINENGHLPPAFIADDNGTPMHSWRVLLLPEFGLNSLYARYNFNEPWNGPHNKKLIAEMPEYTYDCKYIRHQKGKTNYVAVIGPDTVWNGSKEFFKKETGGKWRRTIWILELNDSDIDWTEPRDLTIEEAIAYIQGKDSTHWKRLSKVYGLTGSMNRINIPATATTEVLEALFSTDESKV